MMDTETIRTIAWTVTIIFMVQSATIYSIIHLFVRGRGIIERRELEAPATSLHVIGGAR